MNITAGPDTFPTYDTSDTSHPDDSSHPYDTSDTVGAPSALDVGPHPLTRPIRDRMLVGVAAGIADYLDLDPTIVRIILAVLAVVGGVGVPLYLAGWLLIPEQGAEKSIAADILAAHRTRSR